MSVGMSLVFNAAFRLDGIASVYAGPNDPQIGRISSTISSTRGGGAASGEAKGCSRSALKGEPQAEFDLAGSAERVDACSNAHPVHIVALWSGPVNLARSSRQ